MVDKTPYGHDQQEDDSTRTSENVAEDSTFSGDEANEIKAPPPKKRRGAQKKVVTVPIGEGGGSRSKGEVYPPPDSWSWRKYGQKPIKGSPYPRGYYRCSTSKGCPAKKQVERSCLEPTMVLLTYSYEHNHPIPTTIKHQHHHPATTNSAANAAPTAITATTATSTSTSSTAADNIPIKFASEEEIGVFAKRPDLESDNSSSFNEIAGELGWFSDVGSTMMDSLTLVGPTWVDADVAVMLPIGEEDQSLFGDLGELPEFSVVFRRRGVDCGGDSVLRGTG